MTDELLIDGTFEELVVGLDDEELEVEDPFDEIVLSLEVER